MDFDSKITKEFFDNAFVVFEEFKKKFLVNKKTKEDFYFKLMNAPKFFHDDFMKFEKEWEEKFDVDIRYLWSVFQELSEKARVVEIIIQHKQFSIKTSRIFYIDAKS